MEQIQSMAHVLDLLDSIKKYLYVHSREQDATSGIIKSGGGIVFCLSDGRISAGIVFQRRKLYLDVLRKWGVKATTLATCTECQLTLCERNDLKEGEIAFMTDDDECDYSNLKDYYIIMDGVKAVHWGDMGYVEITVSIFRYHYRVEVA